MNKIFTKIASICCLLLFTMAANLASAQGCVGCTDNCVTINMTDSFGDGWNGATYTITDVLSATVVAFGDLNGATTGDGVSVGSEDWCLADGDYTITVGGGTFDGEIGWSLSGAVTGTTSGFATVGAAFTVGGDVLGCTDGAALNFNPIATLDDGSCIVPTCGIGPNNISYCYDSNENTTFTFTETNPGTGVILDVVAGSVEGGFDTFSIYDGADNTAPVLFSGDGNLAGIIAVSTGASITIEITSDGSVSCASGSQTALSLDIYCASAVLGCTDPIACNFDGTATVDDGSCDLLTCAGCTDPTAANFDPTATLDDGSCAACASGELLMTIEMEDTFGDGWDGTQYFLTTDLGALIGQGDVDTADQGDGVSFGADSYCLAPGCYVFDVVGGNFPGEKVWSVSDNIGNTYAAGTGLVAGQGIDFGLTGGCAFAGCTDPTAVNFDLNAGTDDGSCLFAPDNDLICNAEAITCGSSIIGTTALSSDAEALIGTTCGAIGVTSTGVWYEFNAAADQQIFVSACGSTSGIDTKIHVYEAADCNGALTCVAGNDDAGSCPAGSFLSEVVFNATTGTNYFIYVSEFGVGQGLEFNLEVTCVDCLGGVPSNDLCANATPVLSGFPVTQSLCCAGAAVVNDFAPAFATTYDVWFVVNSGTFDAVALSVEVLTAANAGITIYDGGDCLALNSAAGGGPVTGEIAGDLSDFVTVTPGTNYLIQVWTTDPLGCGDVIVSATGNFLGCTDATAVNFAATATLDDGSCDYTGVVPVNDLCADALPLPCNAITTGSTGGATATGAPLGVANCDADPGTGVWYTFVGTGELHTLSSCGSVIDSRVNVYSSDADCAGVLSCVAASADAFETCGFFDQDDFAVEFVSEIGVNYYVYVGAEDDGNPLTDNNGLFDLDFTCAPVVEGCTNPVACDYDATANVDTGCDFLSCACDLNPAGFGLQLNMVDAFGDGWNDLGTQNSYEITSIATGTVVATGSIDDAIFSVDENNFAGPESGFDILCLDAGCYDLSIVGGGIFAAEISWELVDDLGTVIASADLGLGDPNTVGFAVGGAVCGCTDATACNFDAAATTDDGSCEYTSCAGCTDALACNFDATATIEDGSCCFDNCVTLNMADQFGDGWNGAVYEIYDAGSNALIASGDLDTAAGGDNAATGVDTFCLADGCYYLVVTGGTFPGEVSWTLIGANSGILSGGAPTEQAFFSVGTGDCIVGCMEPIACNFDPAAIISDCTLCDYSTCLGCTYEEAENYDATALIDDGSCTGLSGSCPSDFTGDGIVNAADLLIFLGDFGSVCN